MFHTDHRRILEVDLILMEDGIDRTLTLDVESLHNLTDIVTALVHVHHSLVLLNPCVPVVDCLQLRVSESLRGIVTMQRHLRDDIKHILRAFLGEKLICGIDRIHYRDDPDILTRTQLQEHCHLPDILECIVERQERGSFTFLEIVDKLAPCRTRLVIGLFMIAF